MHYYVPGYSKDNPEMKAPQYWVKEYIYALWTRERAFTKKSYLLGWQMTAADVVIYNDLAFFIRLTHNRKDIWIDKFEHLQKWMTKFVTSVIFIKYDVRLEIILHKFTKNLDLLEIKISEIAKFDSTDAKQFAT